MKSCGREDGWRVSVSAKYSWSNHPQGRKGVTSDPWPFCTPAAYGVKWKIMAKLDSHWFILHGGCIIIYYFRSTLVWAGQNWGKNWFVESENFCHFTTGKLFILSGKIKGVWPLFSCALEITSKWNMEVSLSRKRGVRNPKLPGKFTDFLVCNSGLIAQSYFSHWKRIFVWVRVTLIVRHCVLGTRGFAILMTVQPVDPTGQRPSKNCGKFFTSRPPIGCLRGLCFFVCLFVRVEIPFHNVAHWWLWKSILSMACWEIKQNFMSLVTLLFEVHWEIFLLLWEFSFVIFPAQDSRRR